MLATKEIIPILRNVFPQLKSTSKKGDNGRIAVIGGSF
jgi:NAD(P)H-hydrate repair Nnr-like enzyme with NAD(P)H-hydrate dehydratase domain